MHEKFKLIQSRKQFARLLKLCDDQEKALAEDPRPFLDQAYKQLSQALKLVDEIKAVAYGCDEILRPYNPNEPITFQSPQDTAFRRLEKVKKLISDSEDTQRRG